MDNEFEIIYSLKDFTFEPTWGYLLASQIGLVMFFVMLFSFIDLRKYIKKSIRLGLLGVSIFGLLMFGSLASEYRGYHSVHDALISNQAKTIEGKVANYQENNRGYKTFTVNGIKFATAANLDKPISNDDTVRIEYNNNNRGIIILNLSLQEPAGLSFQW